MGSGRRVKDDMEKETLRADVVGKVFIAVSQDVRRCLICESLFTRRGAAEHTRAVCHPAAGHSGFDGGKRKWQTEKAS
jgi:hypothetical protein